MERYKQLFVEYKDPYTFLVRLKQYDKWVWKEKEHNFIINWLFNKATTEDIDYYEQRWKEFIHLVDTKLSKYKASLIQIEILNLVKDFLFAMNNYPPKFIDVRLYAENGNMGWLLNLKTGKVEPFEGTDEPTKNDLLLAKAFQKPQFIQLYATHDYDFVQSWKSKGIPEDTFFAVDKNIAKSYWHTKGNDVLLSIFIWSEDLLMVDSQAYKTIKQTTNFQKLKIIG